MFGNKKNLGPSFGEDEPGLGMQSTRNQYCLDNSTVADPHTFIKFPGECSPGKR